MTLTTDSIPAELRDLPQWVVWKYEQRGNDKPTKVPYQVNGQYAKTTDPQTWTTYEVAASAVGFSGVGFVFAEGGGLVGIDLDNSIDADGRMKPWGEQLVKRFDTYCEVSPSGRGVKLWARGTYHGEGTGKRSNWRDGAVEMYHSRRFFTVTGQRHELSGNSIREDQKAIDGLYQWVFSPPPRIQKTSPMVDAAERCRRYIEKCPEAISGQDGHGKTLRAACECYRFGLNDSEAWSVMQWFNGAMCQPQWSDRELQHKLKDGHAKVAAAGELGMRTRPPQITRAQIVNPPEMSTGLHKLIDDVLSGKRSNVEWPYSDRLTNLCRALLPGTITVLCGSGGSTKSMWLSQCSLGWVEAGVPFSVFHLEEDREFHQYRALAQAAGDANILDDQWVRANPEQVHMALEKHGGLMDALGSHIWDAPGTDVSLDDLIGWIEQRAHDGHRVICIDPVTAADSGREPWAADRRFVLDAKRIMRDANASLVVVTHPRSANKGADPLDNMAGGRAWNRFTQSLLWLTSQPDEVVRIVQRNMMGLMEESSATINRRMKIVKTRNGKGSGWDVGYVFDSRTLGFSEVGAVKDD